MGPLQLLLLLLLLLLVIFTQSSTNRRGPAARADSFGGGKGGEAVQGPGSRRSREPGRWDKPSPSSMKVRWGRSFRGKSFRVCGDVKKQMSLFGVGGPQRWTRSNDAAPEPGQTSARGAVLTRLQQAEPGISNRPDRPIEASHGLALIIFPVARSRG
jgi:hypothetical protein